MDGLTVGILLFLTVLAAGAAGFAVAIYKTSQYPDVDELQKRFRAELATEREDDRRHYAAAFESMSEIAARIKKRTAVENGEKGGRPRKEEEEPPVPLTRDQLRDQIAFRARQQRR